MLLMTVQSSQAAGDSYVAYVAYVALGACGACDALAVLGADGYLLKQKLKNLSYEVELLLWFKSKTIIMIVVVVFVVKTTNFALKISNTLFGIRGILPLIVKKGTLF